MKNNRWKNRTSCNYSNFSSRKGAQYIEWATVPRRCVHPKSAHISCLTWTCTYSRQTDEEMRTISRRLFPFLKKMRAKEWLPYLRIYIFPERRTNDRILSLLLPTKKSVFLLSSEVWCNKTLWLMWYQNGTLFGCVFGRNDRIRVPLYDMWVPCSKGYCRKQQERTNNIWCQS